MLRVPASLLLAALLIAARFAAPAQAQEQGPAARTVIAGEEGRALDAAILLATGGKFWGTVLEYSWNWGNRGATGVVTTACNLLAWHRALLGESVLGEAAKRALYEVEKAGCACGWFVETTPRGTAKIHHGGATAGYHSQFSRYLDEDVVVIVLTNEEFDAAGLERRLASVLFSTGR